MRLVKDLRLERLERCLSQEDMAEAVGITQSSWSRAERGLSIGPANARAIAKFLDCKPREIWDFDAKAAA